MTEDEINAEIAIITTAIEHILKGGQSYVIGSGSSRREVTMADYDTLVKRRSDLYAQLNEVTGNTGFTLSAGW